jgi:predicted nucleic-acid-binding protein
MLVRAIVQDDVKQGRIAARVLEGPELIALLLPVLCELVWVMRRVYGLSKEDIASAIVALVSRGKITTNRPAVEASLAVLMAGGDFADGVIVFEGKWLGRGDVSVV